MTHREFNRWKASERRRLNPEADRARKREWYARNRGAINARRRARYASDPEYRANVLYDNDCSRIRRMREAASQDEAPASRYGT